MDFKKFFIYQIIFSGLSVVFFLSLGYFFSTFIHSITKDFKVIGLSIIAFLVIFVLAEKFIVKIFNYRFYEKIKDTAIEKWNGLTKQEED